MAFGLLYRPRSKKRCLILSVAVLLMWFYVPFHMTVSPVNYLTRPTVHSQMLDHLNKPLCPLFRKYDRQKLLLLEPSECNPIESQHPDFSADICFSPYTCNEGLVRVRRKDRGSCKIANTQYPISENATHTAFHRQFSGPDSFHVVFSGAEKLSPPDWYHAGQCLYVFPFHISNPGKLTLDITHLYDNYGAVAEGTGQWPTLTRQKVVTALPLEVCRGCPSRVAAPRFPFKEEPSSGSSSLSSSSSDSSNPALAIVGVASGLRNRYEAYAQEAKAKDVVKVNTSSLPLCSRETAVQGAWLPAHPEDKQSWRRSNYTWTPLGCTFGKPLDLTCLQRKQNVNKILFQGDSHLRVAMELLLRRLNGTEILQEASKSMDRLEQTYGATTMTYLHDPLFAHSGEKSDVLVANMGHWATGTKFLDQQWTTSKYHDKLRDLVEVIQQRARDLQDLEDEDFDSIVACLDGDCASGADDDEGHDEDDADEDELERERELTRKKANEDDLEVFWGDETEEERIESRPKRRPSADEDDEEEYDAEDERFLGGRGRYSGGDPGYVSEGQYKEDRPMDRPRSNYPANRILRQSKHLKASSQEALDEDRETEEEEGTSRRVLHFPFKSKVMNGGVKAKSSLEDEDIKSNGNNRGSQNAVKHADTHAKMNQDEERTSSSSSRRVSSVRARVTKNTKNAVYRDPYTYRNTASSAPRRSNTRTSINNSNDRSADRSRRTSNIHQGSRNNRLDARYRRLSRRGLIEQNDRLQKQVKPLKMAWMGMVAYPETLPSDPFYSHDWRTLARLRYWNQIAEDVMLLHNVRFMDFFSMTLSMLDTSPDRSHYYGTDAAEAMLEELQFKLGLCEDEDEE